jgi:hypothetical protein
VELEEEFGIAHANPISRLQEFPPHTAIVHKGPIGTIEIREHVPGRSEGDPGMAAGCPTIGQDQCAAAVAADVDHRCRQADGPR